MTSRMSDIKVSTSSQYEHSQSLKFVMSGVIFVSALFGGMVNHLSVRHATSNHVTLCHLPHTGIETLLPSCCPADVITLTKARGVNPNRKSGVEPLRRPVLTHNLPAIPAAHLVPTVLACHFRWISPAKKEGVLTSGHPRSFIS